MRQEEGPRSEAAGAGALELGQQPPGNFPVLPLHNPILAPEETGKKLHREEECSQCPWTGWGIAWCPSLEPHRTPRFLGQHSGTSLVLPWLALLPSGPERLVLGDLAAGNTQLLFPGWDDEGILTLGILCLKRPPPTSAALCPVAVGFQQGSGFFALGPGPLTMLPLGQRPAGFS